MATSTSENDASLSDYNILNSTDVPVDVVTSIVWAPNKDAHMFACTDVDSKIRIYGVSPSDKAILQKACFSVKEPCICSAWTEDMTKLYAGSLDASIQEFDVASGKSQNIGQHKGGVSGIYWLPTHNLICTLCFDDTIKFWDPRQSNSVESHSLGQKVKCSDMMFPLLAVGLDNEKIQLINLSNLQNAMKEITSFESPLGKGSRLTNIGLCPDGKGLGITAHDGRGNISHIREYSASHELESIVTFKCHVSEDKKRIYPAYGIEFNSRSKSLAYTAGGDGTINYWDFLKKDKITTYKFENTSVVKIKTSPDGEFLAYALGYDWKKAVVGCENVRIQIGVHAVKTEELSKDTK